jgi:hypothetical protein
VSPTAGYSGTPLPQKLGIRAGHSVGLDRAPAGFAETLGELPAGARLASAGRGKGFDVILFFVRDRKSLDSHLATNVARMEAETALWICWPKKTSRLVSDVSESDVRAEGLAAGIVDVKICAVDEDWSGLKFVYRLKDRPSVASGRRKKK